MKTLILTEKPSVARDFAKALDVKGNHDGYMENNDYIITWAVGHLVELLEPDDYDPKWKKWRLDTLPILPDQFKYKPLPKTEKQLHVIQNLLADKPVDSIVIATDAGREGEVIARTILLASDFKDYDKVKRFWTSQALTPEVVRAGMAELKAAGEYDRLWKAGQCRQIADWLVGMNGSRAATIRMNDLFTVGRVQTAVLSLLADRRRERENFKPEPYWVLRALFSNEKGDWWGTWFNKEDETRFKTEAQATEIQAKIEAQTGKVLSLKKQKKKQPPPLLYSLTDLQQDANRKFGFSAENTLNIAQALYESRKCLSYPRTDSKVLGSQNVGMTKNLVKKLSQPYMKYFAGVEEKLISGDNKRVFNDAKLTDHHALIPLAPVPKNAEQNEMKIYGLVLKRFAAAFHPDCEYEQTEILTEVEKETFRTTGKRILKPGWQAVYDTEPQQDEEKPSDDDTEPENLPPLVKGDAAEVKENKLQKKQTTPSPEYSDALLLKDMTNPGKYVSEDELKKVYRGDVGLGTQATRAQIIETLMSRGYAERKKKHIVATDKGCFLIDTLRKFDIAKHLVSPEETARWEMQLNQIAYGEGSDKDFLDSIRSFVSQTVEEFKTGPNSHFSLLTSHLGNCPACGGKVIKGKRDYGCSNWKEADGACRFVIRKYIQGRMITRKIVSALLAKKEAGPLNGFISPDRERYAGMLRLVKGDNGWQTQVEPCDTPPDTPANPISTSLNGLGECPVCGGEVVAGTKGYGCANWRTEKGNCKFVIWKTMCQKEISEKYATQLLENGITDLLFGFTSKKGKAFSARLRLDADVSGMEKAVFDFPEERKE